MDFVILRLRLAKAVIREACWHHVGTLGHSGGQWEQQEGHVEVWVQIFIDCGTIWGTHFEIVSGIEA